MYKNIKTFVKIYGKQLKQFVVKVGVHRSLFLSVLFAVIVTIFHLYLKFCVHLAYKGNHHEFRKHPKIKWLTR